MALYISLSGKVIRNSKRITFISLLMFIPLILQSQSYYFDNYSVEDGLNSSKVYSLLQDQNDYIWLGTAGGVSRFDGIYFENFTSENGLAPKGVFTVFTDSRANLWLGHLDGGISRYNGTKFEIFNPDSIQLNSDITSITETSTGQIWFTTAGNGAILMKNPFTEIDQISAEVFRGKEGLSDKIFNSLLTRDGTFYCLTDVGIKKYNKTNNKFDNYILPDLTKYWMKTVMFEDSNGNLWFGTYHGGLYKYLTDQEKMVIYDKRDGLANNWISYITEDSQGNVWVGTWGGGITRFSGEKMTNFTTDNGLNASYIQCITEDREGNIVIASQYHGLFIFKGESFITIMPEEGLPDKNVWAIQQDKKGSFWFGTNKGICVFDPLKTGKEKIRILNREKNMIDNKIRFIKEDMNNNLWIGSNGGGVFQYLIDEEKFIFDTYLNQLLPVDHIVNALEIDNKNRVWIGANDRLILWDNDKGEGKTYTQIYGLAGNHITALLLDSNNDIWIGSEAKNGLTKYIAKRDTFIRISPENELVPKTMAEDLNGNIWIGTTSGVYVVEKDSIKKHYSISDGLLSNIVSVINVDNNNNIYIGSNNGLNILNQSENKIYTFCEKNGYVGIETKDNASFMDTDNNLWFGTANGVTKYDPGKARKNIPEPLTHIKSLKVNYESRAMAPGMNLSHVEKSLIFDYYSICLSNPGAVRYKIMLKGAEDDWRPETTTTRAIYPSLSPGKYSFKVIAKNSSGTWNSEPVTYDFVIRPPFYQSWWFILGCIILAFIAVFVFIKVRERNLIIEKQILEKKVAERTAEVVQKSEEIEEKNKDITASIRYAKRIQKAILPPEDSIPDTFILFKPKDIVSGDFYWLHILDSKQFIAAVDCTGHGVPGAFMSLIGHNSLNKIVKEYGFTEPAAILDQLNDEVSGTLTQQIESDEVKDGMDLSLIVYDSKINEIQYAGAYNALYLIRDEELIETKADRFSIGLSSIKVGQKFTNHTIKVKEGDVFYLFSDGYADQFGGIHGKKFKTRNVKELLLSIQHMSMNEQKEHLDKTIEEWRGELSQIDDILLIGMRITT